LALQHDDFSRNVAMHENTSFGEYPILSLSRT
jgi:hypothetical protein